MRTLTEEKFDSAISKGKVLVCFSSAWCEPCKKLIKILDDIEGELYNMKLYEFSIDKMDKMIDRFDVSKVPTSILFEDGQEIRRFVGSKTEKDIFKFLDV